MPLDGRFSLDDALDSSQWPAPVLSDHLGSLSLEQFYSEHTELAGPQPSAAALTVQIAHLYALQAVPNIEYYPLEIVLDQVGCQLLRWIPAQ